MHGLHFGVNAFREIELLAVLPDEAEDFIRIALHGLKMRPLVRKSAACRRPDAGLLRIAGRRGFDAVGCETREQPGAEMIRGIVGPNLAVGGDEGAEVIAKA